MSNFLKSKKYFTKKELDEYVNRLMTNTEITLMEQRERILELKQENENLALELAARKRKDGKAANDKAQKASEEIEAETKRKCAKDLLRVKEFATRWAEQFDELVKKYDIAESDIVDRLVIETAAIASPYENAGESLSESEINARFENLLARVKDKRRKTAEDIKATEIVEDDAFDIDEALNPVDPLDAILKDLLGDA